MTSTAFAVAVRVAEVLHFSGLDVVHIEMCAVVVAAVRLRFRRVTSRIRLSSLIRVHVVDVVLLQFGFGTVEHQREFRGVSVDLVDTVFKRESVRLLLHHVVFIQLKFVPVRHIVVEVLKLFYNIVQ